MKRLVLVVLFLCAARTASAECAPPTPQLVWFWPEKSATGVPTNASIWAVGSGVHVTIGATELQPAGTTGIDRYRYEPGPLAASSEVSVLFTVGDGATTKKVPLKFTTGAAADTVVPAAPTVSGEEIALTDGPGDCPDLGPAQGCFDHSTARAKLTFGASTPVVAVNTSEGWILWPSTCTPNVSQTTGCYDVEAVSVSGTPSSIATFCPGSATTVEGGHGGGGASSCTVGGHPASPLWLLLALPLLLRRRSPA